jgi:hypothetical protein
MKQKMHGMVLLCTDRWHHIRRMPSSIALVEKHHKPCSMYFHQHKHNILVFNPSKLRKLKRTVPKTKSPHLKVADGGGVEQQWYPWRRGADDLSDL